MAEVEEYLGQAAVVEQGDIIRPVVEALAGVTEQPEAATFHQVLTLLALAGDVVNHL